MTVGAMDRTFDAVDRPLDPARPTLDGAGRLLYRERWVVLSLTEERAAVPLVRSFGHVVLHEDLCAAGWPAGRPSPNCRIRMMRRLSARCRALGLDVTTVRGRGYILSEDRSGSRVKAENAPAGTISVKVMVDNTINTYVG
jgi:DNA-binding winged helix-turn-helix (wHTH) protein